MATHPSPPDPVVPSLPDELPPVYDPAPAPGEPEGLPWLDPDDDAPGWMPQDRPGGQAGSGKTSRTTPFQPGHRIIMRQALALW